MTHEEVTLIGGLISALPNLAVALTFLVLFVRGDVVSRSTAVSLCSEQEERIIEELHKRFRDSQSPAGVDNPDKDRRDPPPPQTG